MSLWKFIRFFVFVLKVVTSLSPNLVDVAASSSITLPLGSPCDFTSQCLEGAYCGDGRCRKNSCRQNYECAKGELCNLGKVDGDIRNACFAFIVGSETKIDYCSSKGRPITNAGGFVETCDLDMPCLGHSVCNPIYGICCSKLRACPYPRQPVLESDTHRPIICQLRGNRQLECPLDSQCEKSTGFCCANEKTNQRPSNVINLPESELKLPKPGERCEEGEECEDNSICECEHGICTCQCLRTMGYTLDENNHVCRRTRRRLKERCKFDMDCQAAYSECSSGGCRCKAGFQRDGNGGCKPIAYKCVNHAEPLRYDEKIIACIAEKIPINREIENIELMNDVLVDNSSTILNIPLAKRSKREVNECPTHYYCVPIFDVPKKPHLYQGFCCPSPEPEIPVCPVGNPHSSSQAPNFGCEDCPWDHFCHIDRISTHKKICCPKPCLSPEDIYSNGQCYPIAYYGDSCFVNEQCVGKIANNRVEDFESETSDMDCIKGICGCPNGFQHVDSKCKKLQCTVGIKSAPSLDTSGNVLRCRASRDCNQGQICDQTIHACCKGTNHCPKNYSETGRLCESDETCMENEICTRSRKGKKRICCKLENE